METFLSGVKTAAIFIWENLVWINLIFAIVIVFFQRRDPKSVWAWLLVLYFVPILGFIFYLLVGSDMHKRKIFVTKGIEDRINRAIRQQEYMLKHADVELIAPKLSGFSDQVMFNLETQGSVLSDDNDIDIFTDGRTKFDKLIGDIKSAKESIHI